MMEGHSFLDFLHFLRQTFPLQMFPSLPASTILPFNLMVHVSVLPHLNLFANIFSDPLLITVTIFADIGSLVPEEVLWPFVHLPVLHLGSREELSYTMVGSAKQAIQDYVWHSFGKVVYKNDFYLNVFIPPITFTFATASLIAFAMTPHGLRLYQIVPIAFVDSPKPKKCWCLLLLLYDLTILPSSFHVTLPVRFMVFLCTCSDLVSCLPAVLER